MENHPIAGEFGGNIVVCQRKKSFDLAFGTFVITSKNNGTF